MDETPTMPLQMLLDLLPEMSGKMEDDKTNKDDIDFWGIVTRDSEEKEIYLSEEEIVLSDDELDDFKAQINMILDQKQSKTSEIKQSTERKDTNRNKKTISVKEVQPSIDANGVVTFQASEKENKPNKYSLLRTGIESEEELLKPVIEILEGVDSHFLMQKPSKNKKRHVNLSTDKGVQHVACPNCKRKFLKTNSYFEAHVKSCMGPKKVIKSSHPEYASIDQFSVNRGMSYFENHLQNEKKESRKTDRRVVNKPCGYCQECQNLCGTCESCILMPQFGGSNPNRFACKRRSNACENVMNRKIKKERKPLTNCDKCGKYFDIFISDNKRKLKNARHRALQHLRSCGSKDMEPTLKCLFCENKYRDQYLLKRHIRQYHQKKHKCDKCTYKCGSKHELQKHIDHKHNGLVFTCEVCGISLAYKKNYDKHMATVHGGKVFDCQTCSHSTNTEANLKRHKEHMHSDIYFDCDSCPAKYHTQRSLDAHKKRLHGPAITLGCDLCDYQTKDKVLLKKHKERVHEGKKYKCESCEYTSSNSHVIKIHFRSKHLGQYFKCEKCDSKYPKKSVLRYHYETKHNNENLHKCDKCAVVFNHQYTLQRHNRDNHNNTNIDGYKCSMCSYRTKISSTLNSHKITKHRYKIDKCNECDYKTKHRGLLEEHKNFKHRGLGFKCEVCGIKKSRKQYLTEHINKKHHVQV